MSHEKKRTSRKSLESQAQYIAQLVKRLCPWDCAFCVLLWGGDQDGQQWRTFVHNVEPVQGATTLGDCRRALAAELRSFADVIEQRADLPPGQIGHG